MLGKAHHFEEHKNSPSITSYSHGYSNKLGLPLCITNTYFTLLYKKTSFIFYRSEHYVPNV